MTFVAAAAAFYLVDGNTLAWVLAVSIVGTILNYVMGDLLVLPGFCNIVASIGDGGMAAATAYA